MILFSSNLSEVENYLLKNIKKTRFAFSDETRLLELGLKLMHDIAQETRDMAGDYRKSPNLLTNYNLFARNRELLLNAYFCMLSSSYGTQVVILRVVLENSFLMRLFRKEPQFAFEWLSKEIQEQFSSEMKSRYGRSGLSDRKIKVDLNKGIFRDLVKKEVRINVDFFYKQLSDYSHPNFAGWAYLTSSNGKCHVAQNNPRFSPDYAFETFGMMFYFMQLSFKAFYETFKDSLQSFAPQLDEWQENYKKLMMTYYEGKRILS